MVIFITFVLAQSDHIKRRTLFIILHQVPKLECMIIMILSCTCTAFVVLTVPSISLIFVSRAMQHKLPFLLAVLCVSRLLKQHHWIGPKNQSYNCKCEVTRKKGLMFMIKGSSVRISSYSFKSLSQSQFLSIQIILNQLKCEKKQVEKMTL